MVVFPISLCRDIELTNKKLEHKSDPANNIGLLFKKHAYTF